MKKMLTTGILLFTLLTISIVKVFAQKSMKAEILADINKYRAEKGLPALAANDKIEAAAEKHSRDMATGSIPFGHSGFNKRMNKLMKQLAPANACAENVAYGASTANEVVAMWLHSTAHRKNIEGHYNLSGIGIAEDKNGRKYYTQIFIRSNR